MLRLDVRRLAAVDLHGARGRLWHRRVILVEFLAGVVGCFGLGLAARLTRDDAAGRRLGVWLTGVGLNSVPLALSPPGALEAELRGVDVPAELRHSTLAQLWLAGPLLVAGLGLTQALHRRGTR